MKRCARCKVEKPDTEFDRRGKLNRWLDSYCKSCKRENTRRWAAANKGTIKRLSFNIRMRNRLRVIDHYGGTCRCCGEAELAFLGIDHIGGGGTAHRASLGGFGRGGTFYRWLIKQGFPDGYRVLCHNCNLAYGLYGSCPHQLNHTSAQIEEFAAKNGWSSETEALKQGKLL